MSDQPSRRDFAAGLALLAAAPLARADDKPAEQRTTPADAFLVLIKARYGKQLTDEQLTAIANRLRGATFPTALYRTPLKNSDEPAFVFGVD